MIEKLQAVAGAVARRRVARRHARQRTQDSLCNRYKVMQLGFCRPHAVLLLVHIYLLIACELGNSVLPVRKQFVEQRIDIHTGDLTVDIQQYAVS